MTNQLRHGSINELGQSNQALYKRKLASTIKSSFKDSEIANDLITEGYPLTVNVMQRFWEFLDREDVVHNPSVEERLGLLDLSKALEASAKGYQIDPINLSSLRAGVGKTTTMTYMLAELIESDLDIGAVICFSTNEAIMSLIEEIKNISPELFKHIGVYTSNPKMSDHGSYPRGYAHHAKILLVTQQHISGNRFNADTVFYYGGKKRKLTVYDEQFQLGKVSELSSADLFAIGSTLPSNVKPENDEDGKYLTEELLELISQLKNSKKDSKVEIFDFAKRLSLIGKKSYLDSINNNELREKAATLWDLSGKTAICAPSNKGTVVLQYQVEIPKELLPVIVLDASGTCTNEYELMDKYKYKVCRRYVADRDDSDITFHIWNKGSGRSNFKNRNEALKRAEIFGEEISKEEESLTFHFKNIKIGNGQELNFEEILRKQIKGDQGKHHMCQFGFHLATNEYKQVKRIFFLGNLFATDSYGKGSSLLHGDEKLVTEVDFDKTKIGQFKHNLLQACYRGHCRNSYNGKSGKCDIYLMMSSRSGYEKHIRDLFPTANFKEWKVVDPDSFLGKTIELLKNKLRVHMRTQGSAEGFKAKISGLVEKLECSPRNFTRVRNTDRFKEFLEANSLRQVGKNGDSKDRRKFYIEYHSYF